MAVSLNDLPIEPTGPVVDFDNYQDPQEFAPPVPEGTVNLRTTRAEIEKFDQSTGVLSVVYDHDVFDIATGQKVGTLNFDRVSTKVFNRNNVPASMAADMLRAMGVTTRPSSPREWGEQLIAAKAYGDAGNFWTGVIKWDGYCSHKDTSFETAVDGFKKPLPQQPEGHRAPTTLRGAKNWPLEGANGSEHRATEVPCTVCGTPIQARAKIDRRVPKS
jgi:hypothetical protein